MISHKKPGKSPSSDKRDSKPDRNGRPSQGGRPSRDGRSSGPRHSQNNQGGGRPYGRDNRSGGGGGGGFRGRGDEEEKDVKLSKRDNDDSIHLSEDRLEYWKKETQRIDEERAQSVGRPFELDPWQSDALDVLRRGDNLVVDAPTTAGKTRAVEAFFDENHSNPNFRAAYTTPVKSLSNDKLREFRERYGVNNVGIATGDIKENLSAPIVVTTLETYRNSLLGVEPDLRRSLVIFDEYHFMQDESRGSAWEESIILTPESCQMALLSASVANGEEFVGWLERVHSNRRTTLIRTTHRPVPLEDWIYAGGRWRWVQSIGNKKSLQYKGRGSLAPKPQEIAEKLAALLDTGLTPCIAYSGRRKSTEYLAAALVSILPPLGQEEKNRIAELLEAEQKDSKALDFIPRDLRHAMTGYGVAYHHSGMPPPVRLAVERCLKEGALRFCSATMGLSIGINFSVKSSVITDFTRPGEQGFSKYTSSEVLQMLGRAGRRGKDPVGFSLWLGTDFYNILQPKDRQDCSSRLKNDPTTFLGLVSRGMDEPQLENFYGKSFKRFVDKGVDLGLIRASRILKKIDEASLPCTNPAYELGLFQNEDPQSKCPKCPLREKCHRYMDAKSLNDTASLQLHLYRLGAISEEKTLTDFGNYSKHVPQAGGMVIAKYIQEGVFNDSNLLMMCQILASFSLAYHKAPNTEESYRLPLSPRRIAEDLEHFYPPQLFLELYDQDERRRSGLIYREFNPDAGYAVLLWLSGTEWKELVYQVCNEKFAQGDLMSLMYRVGSYLQSISQIENLNLGPYIKDMREELLRDPITPKI